MSLTKREEWLLDVVMDAVGEGLKPVVKELRDRLDLLESQQTTLADCFKGGHVSGQHYERGSLVQKQGGIYLALTGTSETPGSSDSWRQIGRV